MLRESFFREFEGGGNFWRIGGFEYCDYQFTPSSHEATHFLFAVVSGASRRNAAVANDHTGAEPGTGLRPE
jgi:hypothetical protein